MFIDFGFWVSLVALVAVIGVVGWVALALTRKR
jgi:hypothetical protein